MKTRILKILNFEWWFSRVKEFYIYMSECPKQSLFLSDFRVKSELLHVEVADWNGSVFREVWYSTFSCTTSPKIWSRRKSSSPSWTAPIPSSSFPSTIPGCPNTASWPSVVSTPLSSRLMNTSINTCLILPIALTKVCLYGTYFWNFENVNKIKY